ncbi:sigma-54-dependent Fis family transcriptional regulator [bacterium]|nr:sigma-54-dependent Fis family transcriptional regulator [bacterium]RQV93806.1 MAG: sigma-54-dependent Fis family transcriptional regulator [bacterium]
MADVLLIDDEKSVRSTLSVFLQKSGYKVDEAANGEDAAEKLKQTAYDLVITDLKMKPMGGLEVLQMVKKINPLTEVVVMTAYGTVESGVEAMKLGAYDYIQKPFDKDEFLIVVGKALERKELLVEVEQLQDELEEKYKFENIIGNSNEMRNVFSMVAKVAPTDSTILISGESGTGKELIAKAIHLHSRRKNRSFVTINCGALPENLQESELFGHVRGAFTGAIREKRGLFQEANGGTLFLDEIGETAPSTQVKLLRFLQDGEIRRVGENEPVYVDVRLLAATNQDLEKAIEEGTFREDLYYRLNVIPIHVPPLRNRRDDIPLLINHFLERYLTKSKKKIESVSMDAIKILTGYDWPGNVRELENVIERAVILTNRNVITRDDLPSYIHDTQKKTTIQEESIEETTLDKLEKHYILKTLEKYTWNQKKASEVLGISTTTLWRKLKAYGIEPKRKE